MSKYLAFISYRWGPAGHPFAKNVEKMVQYIQNIAGIHGNKIFFDKQIFTKEILRNDEFIEKAIVNALENSSSIILFFNQYYADGLQHLLGATPQEDNYWCPRELMYFIETKNKCELIFNKKIYILSFNSIDQLYNAPQLAYRKVPNSSRVMGLHLQKNNLPAKLEEELNRVCSTLFSVKNWENWNNSNCANQEVTSFPVFTQEQWETTIRECLPVPIDCNPVLIDCN